MTSEKESPAKVSGGEAPIDSWDQSLKVEASELLPGDVLLYRPRNPNVVQNKISSSTGSPYTHAAIYIGNGQIAESVAPNGVRRQGLGPSMQDSQCVGVLRSQANFGGDRPSKLNDFVANVWLQNRFYNLIAALDFKRSSEDYFDNQLEFIRTNYGKVTTDEEFAQQSFFCSAFVVACYTVVGIIGESAQVAYPPQFFSPAGLYQDPTFGWLLGYLIPEGGSVPADDPLLSATLWRDLQDVRWW